MNQKAYFKTQPDGTVSVIPKPPGAKKVNYSKNPVQFSVRRAPLGLEIHGENFSTVIDFTIDEALCLILILGYAVREAAYTPTKCEFVEVTQ